MSNRLYDILNTFNKLVTKDEPKKQLTESAVSKPKSKLEETMAKIESEFQTFKEAKKAKPDFLDVDKDGNKKEPMKKAIKDKKVTEAANLVSGQKLGIQGNLTPFYYSAIAKYLKANGLSSVTQFSSEDIDALSTKLGVSMEAMADLVGFEEVAESFNRNAALYSRARQAGTAKQYLELSKDPSKTPQEQAAYRRRYEKIVANHNLSPGELKEQGVEEAAENPYQQRILDSDPEALDEFLKTGYLDTTSDLYNRMYDYYANQMDPKIRRNMDKQYDFITAKIREVAGPTSESAAPGQEAWIKKNKARFIDQYGKKKGMEVLYATAWKRSKKDEGAYDAEVSEEDPVFEGDDYWDFKDLKDTPTSGTRKVAGTRYGGSAQKDDDDEDDEFGGSKKADAPKRGRGRPKGSGKKMGTRGITGKSKLASKAAIKEADNEGDDMVKLAKVIASCTTPQQLKVAQKMASNFLAKHASEFGSIGDAFNAKNFHKDVARATAVKRDIRAKADSLAGLNESRPSLMDRLLAETYASFNEAEDLTIDQDQLRQHIGDENFAELRRAIQVTGTFPDEMLPELQDYFSSTGEMPYGAATAEDEDPYEWIGKKLEQLFGDEVGYDQENVDIDMGEPDEDYGTFGDDERPEEDKMNAEGVNESKQMVAENLSRILHTYPHEVKTFLAGGDLDNDLYSALVDYYDNQGEMPYRVKTGSSTIDWVADKFGTDLRNVELDEAGPNLSDVPAYMRKQQGQNFPLTRDQITPAEEFLWVVPGPGSRDFEARAFPNTPQGKMAADEFAYGVKGNVVLSAEQPVAEEAAGGLEAELKELARLAGLKESCGEVSPLTQTGAQEPAAGMSINTNVDTRTGTKTMTVTADGEIADKLAEILSLSGLATQVTARSSEVVGQDAEQEPEMQVVAVGETKDDRYHANTTPEPEEAEVDAIIDQGDDLNRKKKQHADKPKLGDNPMATESMSISGRLMRELESIKIKK